MDTRLQELLDKQAITEVLWRYCRGMDRMDRELTLSCWHPGGTDNHAPLFAGTAEGFVDWLWPVHAAMTATRHFVSNITIELSGDKAASESYWYVHLRIPRGETAYDLVGEGRYLDTFEKIDDVWAIRHRSSIGCMSRITEAILQVADFDPPLILPNNPGVAPMRWAREKTDYSYELFAAVAG